MAANHHPGRLHEHLQAKRHAVAAEGGLRTMVMAPAMAGILAHEAMGPRNGDFSGTVGHRRR